MTTIVIGMFNDEVDNNVSQFFFFFAFFFSSQIVEIFCTFKKMTTQVVCGYLWYCRPIAIYDWVVQYHKRCRVNKQIYLFICSGSFAFFLFFSSYRSSYVEYNELMTVQIFLLFVVVVFFFIKKNVLCLVRKSS